MVMCVNKKALVCLQALPLRRIAFLAARVLLCCLGPSSASAALQERLDSVIVCNGSDVLRYEYAYNNNGKLCDSKVYKIDGNAMILQRTSSFGYDALNRNNARVDSAHLNGVMKLEWMYDVAYNQDGKVSQVRCRCPQRGANELSCDSVYYTYDENGLLLRYVCIDCDTKDSVVCKSFVYDEHGRCVECRVTEKYASRPIEVGIDRYEYMAGEKIARDVHIAPTTGFRTETLNEYDSAGHCVSTQIGYTAKPEMEWHTKNMMTYDEYGNLLCVREYMMASSGWVHDKTTVYTYDMEQENVLAPDFDGRLFKGRDLRYGLTENPPCANRLMRIDSFYSDGEEISSVRYFYSDGQNR